MSDNPQPRGVFYRICDVINRIACRILYQLSAPSNPPLPEKGPVLLVSDHSSYNDPMVLSATAGRPIIFLTAREVYESFPLKWLCKAAYFIPVTRGTRDVGAVRSMLRGLARGEVIALFPEGGIDEHREENGHLGIGYLALKTGAPVVPASISWNSERPLNLGRSLITPGKASIRYGSPIVLPANTQANRDTISAVTDQIMQAIRDLKKSSSSS